MDSATTPAFDPSDLIVPPFHTCPRCGEAQFGTVTIRHNVRVLRCRVCSHNEWKRLPPLRKKLIYLDQMVLSGFGMELDPVWRERKPNRDTFWLRVFDQLHRLVKLQLVVCPVSPIHRIESAYDDRYATVLQRLSEHLASGVRLRSLHEVRLLQLSEAFAAWWEDRTPDWDQITPDQVVRGQLAHRSNPWLVTASFCQSPTQVESHREFRNYLHRGLESLWNRFAAEGRERSFPTFFQRERRDLAAAVLDCYTTPAGQSHPVLRNRRIVLQLGQWVLNRLDENGVSERNRLAEMRRFLYSEPALSCPENHLSSLLIATLAWRAATGQKRVPDRGTPNDLKLISAYLPYCDAMFVDKEFAQILSEGPLKTEVRKYPTRVFSSRSRTEFLRYLKDLEAEASPEHVELVTQTYGKRGTEPYREVLEHERGGEEACR